MKISSQLVIAVGAAALFAGSASFYRMSAVQAAQAQASSQKLDAVLRQMDASSAKFQSAQADVERTSFTKIINDTEVQQGIVYFMRKAGATQMGMRMSTEPKQVMEYKDGKVRLYNPGTNHLDEVAQAGANKSRFETFLTLGFGGSGKELESAWTVTDQGPETVDGVATEKLDLVSKDDAARKNISHATIWIDPTRAVSLKQVFYMPSGDTQTAHYTNIKLNQTVNLDSFAIKCKGKCS